MKTFFLGILAGMASAMPSQAALSFIGNAYAELNPNATGNAYYWVNNSDGVNHQFSGNLSGLTIHVGQSLMLGGQVQTYQPETGVTVTLEYSIDGGSFTAMNLPYLKTANNNDWWEKTGGANIDNSLSVGTHTLTIYYMATDGGTTIYDSNNSANFSATFSVVAVPESARWGLWSAAGLLAIGGLRSWRQARRPSRLAT